MDSVCVSEFGGVKDRELELLDIMVLVLVVSNAISYSRSSVWREDSSLDSGGDVCLLTPSPFSSRVSLLL